MNLKEFIRETLSEISDAAHQTNVLLKSEGHFSTVNPTLGPNHFNKPIEVTFDVAVTVEATDSKSVGGGIKVFSMLNAGGESTSDISSSTVSRIKFVVPLALPLGETPLHEINENGMSIVRRSLPRA